MSDLTVALAEWDQVWEDIPANLERLERAMPNLPEHTDVLLLPEMFTTGFSMNVDLAEEWGHSASVERLVNLAANHQTAIYTSLMLREERRVYNRGIWIEPSGSLKIYDKQKTFGLAKEDEVITPGSKREVVACKGWKIQLNICYDLRFPEILRNRLVNGEPHYDALFFVANWPQRRVAHWSALLKARAIENQCYVAGVNRIGEDGNGHPYNGQSAVLDPLGEALSNKNSNPFFLSFVLEKAALRKVRETLPFLKDQTMLKD